jgi:nucleoside 2-deoxyribosyltransferase
MKTIYLSGPMSGYPDHNFPAFHAAAAVLRRAGFSVINPADFGVKEGESWRKCLERDLMVLFHCDTVVTLDGWEESKGAKLEVYVARELGIPDLDYRTFNSNTDGPGNVAVTAEC